MEEEIIKQIQNLWSIIESNSMGGRSWDYILKDSVGKLIDLGFLYAIFGILRKFVSINFKFGK